MKGAADNSEESEGCFSVPSKAVVELCLSRDPGNFQSITLTTVFKPSQAFSGDLIGTWVSAEVKINNFCQCSGEMFCLIKL